jgi:hypothetical protein
MALPYTVLINALIPSIGFFHSKSGYSFKPGLIPSLEGMVSVK